MLPVFTQTLLPKLILFWNTYKKIFLLCIALLFIGSIALYVFISQSQHTIVLTQNGFQPSELTIVVGDTVTFKNKTGKAFWPASDTHPTHTAYPDFDPKKPVEANDTWSFTFTESGVYGFHDHLYSTYEGTIYVQDKKGEVAEIDCTTERSPQCWEQAILTTLEEKGVKAAFDKMVYFSNNEDLFTDDCHGYAHLIGEEAYSLYEADKNFELTPATALCGYGFYHGFMETLLLTTGNIQEARDFCEMADKKLAGQASAASTACYHGTGHGAVDGSDPTAWGDIDAMMEPGFRLCDQLAETELQLYLCNTGVFNAIEVISRDPKYGIADLADDPFAMCNRQPLERREACYSNMLPILLGNYNNDFEAVYAYVNENMIDNDVIAIDGHTINGLVTLGIAFEFIRLHGSDDDYIEKGVALCRNQPEEDHLPCIEGLSGGHIKYGPPGTEYVKNLVFCSDSILTEEERDSCYEYVLPRLYGRYDTPTVQKICSQVAVEYRDKYCR